MAYDASLEVRIDGLTAEDGLGKKKMFGGLAYFVNGTICFAIRGNELLLHVGDDKTEELMQIPGVHTAVMGKRVMKNWLQAGGDAIATDDKLRGLLETGQTYALNNPKQ